MTEYENNKNGFQFSSKSEPIMPHRLNKDELVMQADYVFPIITCFGG